jgi:transposase
LAKGRKFSTEEKIRIVLEGLRGEQSVSDLCRREGIASNLYYRWSKDFLEAGKKQLAGESLPAWHSCRVVRRFAGLALESRGGFNRRTIHKVYNLWVAGLRGEIGQL